jgi:hypothetical protein
MISIQFRRSLGAVLLATAVAACDNPADEHDDVEPAGVSIRLGTNELVRATRVDQTVVTTGLITVAAGGQTQELTIVFLNDIGNPVAISEDYHVRVQPATSSIATWTFTTPGGYRGHVVGVSGGNTTIGVSLFHGPLGGGHVTAGFNIPVTVTGTTATAP